MPPEAVDNYNTNLAYSRPAANPNEYFAVGVHKLEYTADDGINDPIACSFTITVLDEEEPTFTCDESSIGNIYITNVTLHSDPRHAEPSGRVPSLV